MGVCHPAALVWGGVVWMCGRVAKTTVCFVVLVEGLWDKPSAY